MKKPRKKKEERVRFGVALNLELLRQFDALLQRLGYSNRSKAISELIHNRLEEEACKKGDRMVVGVISVVYDHHQRQLDEKIIDLQHQHINITLASMHIHLDHDNCLELLAVKGKVDEVRRLAGILGSYKGVSYCHLDFVSPWVDK